METKNYCLSDIKNEQNSATIKYEKYANLNLNKRSECSKIVHTESKNDFKETKKCLNASAFYFVHQNSCHSNSNCWSKSSVKSCIMPFKLETAKKREENESKNQISTLHISAYENFVDTTITGNQVFDERNNLKTNSKQYFFSSELVKFKNPFEIPRQAEDSEMNQSEPEIMQFKASQKLLNPKQTTTPTKQSQKFQHYSTPQKGASLNESDDESSQNIKTGNSTFNSSNISNPFHTMPSQINIMDVLKTPPTTKKSSKTFEWSLEEKSLLNPAAIDSSFIYNSPLNSDADLHNEAFWKQEMIAPSIYPLPRRITTRSSSTQTNISIPADFDLEAVLPSFHDVPSYIPSRLSSCINFSFDESFIDAGIQRFDLGSDEVPINMLHIDDISPISSSYNGEN